MSNTKNWQKSFEHKTHRAKVYKDGEEWVYEYEGSGVVTVGHKPTAELAMEQIEDTLEAGIYIRKRKGI